MSISIRGSLLVAAGTFLFKVITIEHTNSKVFFLLQYEALHCSMDGMDGCILKFVSRIGRRYQVRSLFLEGWGGENVLMYYFPIECVNHLVHNVPLASTLKETDGWSKTWKTCEAI